MAKKRGNVAWVITWEGTNLRALPERVAAVLHHRTSLKCIPAIVELLYALESATLEELTAYAVHPESNPYQAKGDDNGRVTCGHNPYLYARLVDQFRVTTDTATKTQLVEWVERPTRRVDTRGARVRVIDVTQAHGKKVERASTGPLWSIGS